MKRPILYLLFVAAAVAHAQNPMPRQPVATQPLVSQVCAPCHGLDGNSDRADIPSLAGQIRAYLHGQLQAFAAQGEQRRNGVMGAIAVNLSDDEMRRAANWYARQRLLPARFTDTPFTAQGKKIFFEGLPDKGVAACASCHGVRGEGLPELFPRLAGQQVAYLAAQLRDFRSGARRTDPEAMMRRLAQGMTDQQIDAVSRYVAAIR